MFHRTKTKSARLDREIKLAPLNLDQLLTSNIVSIYNAVTKTVFYMSLWVFPLFALSLAMAKVAGGLQKMITAVLGYRVYMLVFGWPGTLIHEISHAVAGLMFGHKIESFGINIFGKQNGRAGFVRLKHNPASYYQNAGNFFIAIAPIFGCAAAILFVAAFLFEGLPVFPVIDNWEILSFGIEIRNFVFAMFNQLFLLSKNQMIWTLFFVYFSVTVGSGMRMSVTDMKRALPGSLLLTGLFLIFFIFQEMRDGKNSIQIGVYEPFLYVYAIIILTMGINIGLIVCFWGIARICRVHR